MTDDLRQKLERQQAQLDRIEAMLDQLLHPAQYASIQQKAAAIAKAVATGDKAVKRRVLKQINRK